MNLLPCPFCGQLPKFTRCEDSPPEITKRYWQLGCPGKNCVLNPLAFGDTKKDAAADWNFREDVYTPGILAAVDILLREAQDDAARRLLRNWGIRQSRNDAAWMAHLLEIGSIRKGSIEFIREVCEL